MSARHIRLFRWNSGDIPTPRDDDCVRTWTTEFVTVDFDVLSVIASWNATTPDVSWIEVAVHEGEASAWLIMGRWAETDAAIARTSIADQHTDGAHVDTEEVVIDPARPWRTAQVQVVAHRPDTESAWPELASLEVVLTGAKVPVDGPVPQIRAHAIDVPPYSQQLHRDRLPHLGGGGQNWCSPTSVSMVLAHWRTGPAVANVVEYAAERTYDQDYGGTGNWSFNAAYAGTFGVHAFVTRLRDLDEAELLTRAGIPVVAGVAFRQDQLDGAGYDTEGHLLVIVGFEVDGSVVVNDPASGKQRSNDAVRTTYRRDQFQTAWQVGGSGIVYVIHPYDVPLPDAPAEANW